ncbi:SpoIIE family protein phosphatase [Streptomyces cyslabdanicus]|uniref:SpoIIE family protein phosphatase n=1 Tax=Streptomyces cyslabdanicus TaxID=1470456 RepID=UPI004043A129
MQGATAGELRVALVVGDVMGTSMASAAVTGRLRVAARALGKTALRPAEAWSIGWRCEVSARDLTPTGEGPAQGDLPVEMRIPGHRVAGSAGTRPTRPVERDTGVFRRRGDQGAHQ